MKKTRKQWDLSSQESSCYQLLLDTGCGPNIMNKSFLKALCTEPVAYDFDLHLF